jgi:hypothetical protein
MRWCMANEGRGKEERGLQAVCTEELHSKILIITPILLHNCQNLADHIP